MTSTTSLLTAELALLGDELRAEIARLKGRPSTLGSTSCIYDTRHVAICRGRKVHRLSDEVDFRQVVVVTIDDMERMQSYGPFYFAVPTRPPEINVTRSAVRAALDEQRMALTA